jgi:hypothetical protein
LYLYSLSVFLNIRNARAARRLGAVQYPIVEGKWPGSVDLLINMMRRLDGEYTTDYLAELAEEYGPTYIIRILWDDEVLSSPPYYDMCIQLISVVCFLQSGYNHRASTY